MLTLTLSLIIAQAAAALSPAEQARLTLCLDQARRDPPSAIAEANQWLGESSGAGAALPQQCLGQAYVSLLRWEAAEQAFLAARDAAGETVYEDNPYGPEPTPTHPGFWADGQALRQLEGQIALDCPVRLLHGQEDADVPPEISLRLAAALRSSDVQVTLVKGGDHRLSREQDIALLLRTVAAL